VIQALLEELAATEIVVGLCLGVVLFWYDNRRRMRIGG
jgi:hypothetical protein